MSEKITLDEWLAEFERVNGGTADDETYRKAVGFVVKHQNASADFLQVGLNLGHNQSKRLIARMELDKVISGYKQGLPREVLLREKQDFTPKSKTSI